MKNVHIQGYSIWFLQQLIIVQSLFLQSSVSSALINILHVLLLKHSEVPITNTIIYKHVVFLARNAERLCNACLIESQFFFFNFNSLIRQKNLDIFTQQNIENFRWRFVFYEMVALIFHWKSEQVVLHSLLPVLKYFTANIDDFPLINYLGIVVIVPWSELSGLAADWCILHSI